MDYKQIQIDNFFRYLAVPSQSNAKAQSLPSTQGQYDLALLLKKELEDLGLSDIVLEDNAILSGKLKGNTNKKSIGFCAHLDTVDVGLSEVIKPQILKFEGKALHLNKEKNIFCDPKEHPELLKYLDEDIIFSDGTSVLGADNKAAIATIMTLLVYLVNEKCDHGDVYVCFVPDEEIGLFKIMLLSGGACIFICGFCMLFLQNLVLIQIFVVLSGIFYSMWFPFFFNLPSELKNSNPNQTAYIMSAFWSIAFIILSFNLWVVSWSVDKTHSFTLGFVYIFALIFISANLAQFVLPRRENFIQGEK